MARALVAMEHQLEGDGGDGIQSSITETATYYAGGGGGGTHHSILWRRCWRQVEVELEEQLDRIAPVYLVLLIPVVGVVVHQHLAEGEFKWWSWGLWYSYFKIFRDSNCLGRDNNPKWCRYYPLFYSEFGNSNLVVSSGSGSGTTTSTASFDEGSAVGTVVATLTATDSDTTNLTYSLATGNGTTDQHNSLFTVSVHSTPCR